MLVKFDFFFRPLNVLALAFLLVNFSFSLHFLLYASLFKKNLFWIDKKFINFFFSSYFLLIWFAFSIAQCGVFMWKLSQTTCVKFSIAMEKNGADGGKENIKHGHQFHVLFYTFQYIVMSNVRMIQINKMTNNLKQSRVRNMLCRFAI